MGRRGLRKVLHDFGTVFVLGGMEKSDAVIVNFELPFLFEFPPLLRNARDNRQRYEFVLPTVGLIATVEIALKVQGHDEIFLGVSISVRQEIDKRRGHVRLSGGVLGMLHFA